MAASCALNLNWWFTAPRRWLGLLLLGAVALSVMAVVMQYGFGVIPCKMCWWQRYIHWALGAVALLGWLKPDRKVVLAVAAGLVGLSVAGLGIATWQFLAQNGLLPFPQSCTGEGMAALAGAGDLLADLGNNRMVPCDKETYKLFGLSLAGWNMPIMLGYAVVAGWGRWKVFKG